jgi:GMP synthase (glutamine-hydrolysing)
MRKEIRKELHAYAERESLLIDSKNKTSVFVDNGLLRLNERESVEYTFKNAFPDIQLRVVDAQETFLNALKGVVDPEVKRKTIGRVFIEVFESAIQGEDQVTFLAQGTLYPDVIESVAIGDNPASLIKSHHNVGGLPEHMSLKILEPLRELFKDEVRA